MWDQREKITFSDVLILPVSLIGASGGGGLAEW